ncbi:MAG TPA: hypothetical protein VFW65_21885 [Pseudonocardiaceae bacterium]|nr:hypothetical protein [Pseudonocardiaceae bacterium]
MCDDLLTVLPRLVERLDALEQRQSTGEPSERRSDFRIDHYPVPDTADEREEQHQRVRNAWCRLAAWVDWLVATYRLTSVIPACWPEHPAIVEELVGLRVAWVAAWQDTASADAPAAWQRRLHETKARLVDGNWGVPRCDGHHDSSGLDLADHYHTWHTHPARDKALIAARDRSITTLPAPTIGGDQ